MFKNITLLFVFAFLMISCDRASHEIESPLIPRSVLQAKPDKFCVTMNYIGDKIAYIARKGNGIELCIEDLSGNLVRKFDIKDGLGTYNYCWTITGNHILIGQDNDGDENDHVICLDIKTGTSKDLTPFNGAKSHLLAGSEKYPHEIIIISNKRDPKWYDAYRINVISGKTDLVFRNISEYSEMIFDHDFNLRVVSKRLKNGDVNFYLMKNGRPEFFKKIPFEDEKSTIFTHFDVNNKILYGLTSVNRDKRALAAYDLSNNTSKILFERELADVEEFYCDPNKFVPQYVVVNYLKPEIYVIDKAISNDIAYLKLHAVKKNLNIVCRNKKDDLWLINFSSSNSSRKWYIYKRNAKTNEPISLKFLFSSTKKLDEYQLQEKTPVVIKSRDGLDLVCYLTKSYDFQQANPRKLIVYVHGGPWGRDDLSCDPDVQLLANRGYSVLQVNYRGSMGFGKRFVNIANGNLDKIRNDIIDGVNWAIKNEIADSKYIAIMGGSFGGYATLSGLTFDPNVFCCGVAVVAPSNLVTFLEAFPPYWLSELEMVYKFFGDPRTKEGRKYLIENSPVTHVHKIKKPLLVFQGKNDPRVKQAEADQIVTAMKEKRLPVAYVLYPDEGHGCHKEPNAKSYMALIEMFLAKIMGGRFESIQPGELEGSSHQIIEAKELIGLK